MDQFSTNELITIHRNIDLKKPIEPPRKNISEYYEIDRIVDYVTSNGHRIVCLQFPDHLLPDARNVSKTLNERLGADAAMYVMADSNYESCCVDYLTAKHVRADVIVHFGGRCGSQWTEEIPCLWVYEKEDFDSEEFIEEVQKVEKKRVFLEFDSGYLYKKDEVRGLLEKNGFELFERFSDEVLNVYIGEDDRNLLNYQLKNRINNLYLFNPKKSNSKLIPYEMNSKILKRRNYLIEKIKDSRRVGILIATLSISNFRKALEHIKTLLKTHKKTYYILNVGRPTVTKLANFPEMDIYIAICCPSSEIFESRDFYKPIVTIHDVESALNPKNPLNQIPFNYFIDESIVNSPIEDLINSDPDVSLISGGIRFRPDEGDTETNDDKEIAVRDKGIVALGSSGAEFLSERGFKGLERKVGETEVRLASEGRKGIAQSYENELF